MGPMEDVDLELLRREPAREPPIFERDRSIVMLPDTNGVSCLMREVPEPSVEAPAACHPMEDLFFSVASETEPRFGPADGPSLSSAGFGHQEGAA